MGIDELLRVKRDEILRIAASHGARNLRVFGSVARGEADERSDIDVLEAVERIKRQAAKGARRSCATNLGGAHSPVVWAPV